MKRLPLKRLIQAAVLAVLAIIGTLVAFILMTSAPPPRVPVLSMPKSVVSMPSFIDHRPAAGPNAQAQAQIAADLSPAANLSYAIAHSGQGASVARDDGGCSRSGRWSVDVDPENVIGRPYPAPPSAWDWIRAARALAIAQAICLAPVSISWFNHDLRHPATDSWVAVISATRASGIDGPTLQTYALRHERQV